MTTSTRASSATATPPKRILFVVNVGWFFVSHRLVLAKAAVAAGHDVHAATTITDESERRAILGAGVVLHEVNFDRSGFSPLHEYGTIRALLRLYRDLRPDLVHHVTVKPILYGNIAGRLARVPAVVNAIPGLGYSFEGTGLFTRLRRALILGGYRFALRHPNSRVIFQNSEHMEMFAARGVVRRASTVLIRGSGVDLDRFGVSDEPHGPRTVLLASRMLREKGIHEFVAAAQRLRPLHGDVRFCLAGDVDEDNPGSLDAQQLRAWHASGVVEWLGHRSDIPSLLAQCHIACLPTYGEGLPKFLLEAAACGRPIVTTDIPGCRDIARHGVNALLVPPRDAAALQTALDKLLHDSQLRQTFGAAGRALVQREFSQERVIEQTLQVYGELLACGYTPRPSG